MVCQNTFNIFDATSVTKNVEWKIRNFFHPSVKVLNKHKNEWLDCHVVRSYYFRYTFFWVKYQGFGCK